MRKQGCKGLGQTLLWEPRQDDSERWRSCFWNVGVAAVGEGEGRERLKQTYSTWLTPEKEI